MKEKVFEVLLTLGISFQEFNHKAIFSCDESYEVKLQIPGVHNKSLFLKNSKNNSFLLIILPCEKRLNFQTVSKIFYLPRLSFASEQELFNELSLTPGSVSPFGLIFAKGKIAVIIDKRIIDDTHVSFHPCENTSTIVLETSDFLRFLEKYSLHFDAQKNI